MSLPDQLAAFIDSSAAHLPRSFVWTLYYIGKQNKNKNKNKLIIMQNYFKYTGTKSMIMLLVNGC